MRKTLFPITLLFAFQLSDAQRSYVFDDNTKNHIDSCKRSLATEKNDYKKYNLLIEIFSGYVFSTPDSCITYGQQALALAKRVKSDTLASNAYTFLGYAYSTLGDYPQALAYYQESLKAAEASHYFLSKSKIFSQIALFYLDEGDFGQAISYAKDAKSLMESYWKPSFNTHSTEDNVHDTVFVYLLALESLGQVYEKSNYPDSANTYYRLLTDGYMESKRGKMEWPVIPYYLGNICLKKGDYKEGIRYYHTGVALSVHQANNKDLVKNYYGLADAYKSIGAFDSSRIFATKVVEVSKYAYNPIFKLNALNILTSIYKSENNIDSLATYLQLTIATKDSLFSQQKAMQLQSMTLHQQELRQRLIQANLLYKNRLNIYFLLAGLVVLTIVAAGLWRRNVYKQRSYALLQKQKQEIDFQRTKVEKTLEELKSTQAQLIQSEKMASLGELTAGIAHEIQNPLNFVNNFSEVNKELLTEMSSEISKGHYSEVKTLAQDVINNEEKISEHGKRADAIVKGMLQHSRTSAGQKELTDLNAMCDEYLRLAYHGFRARNKTFNAIPITIGIETDFDNHIGEINIVPQEIGRVLLNLINNALYAVTEKKLQLDGNYEPCVSIKTTDLPGKVEIAVRDNGNGIPERFVDKIFQPFFTTKPTGQGTGLGLSLAYDIVKAHGGEIRVQTKKGEGSEFIIQLPT